MFSETAADAKGCKMIYVVLFKDNPDAPSDLRRRHMAAHLKFLQANPQIKAAGPLAEAGNPAGGLWLVEADDARDIETLIRRDPFWPSGLRATHRILAWNRVHQGAA
ncbi:hypothetical protein U879_12470 [Defluviimonas sp. 20V17]|nr:hypothetical protein U879_12470 [Defluviimonas sp. 20V17]